MTSLNELNRLMKKNSNNIIDNDFEKAKFFNILKSIFAIFDPECNGSIDINELDVLGANNNDILNDVVNYIRSNKILKPVNLNSNSRKYYVTFDEFVHASDIILDRRSYKINRLQNQTLSQAFEPHAQTSSSNANSLDLNSLIDKENYLLRQGLDSLDSLKQWFTQQLIENKIKQTNLNKLKYQNLFSIDKLLIDLKELSDINIYLNDFMIKKKVDLEKIEKVPEPPSYQEYMEHFGVQNIKPDLDLDRFLKEKQERIDSLQREKANLIRKLFEIKSDSENINKNITRLNSSSRQSSVNCLNEKEIPIIIDKGFGKNQPGTYSTRTIDTSQMINKPRYL